MREKILKQLQLTVNRLFKKIKFFEIKNESGNSLIFDSTSIAIGSNVYTKDIEGNVIAASDGEYTIATSAAAIKIVVKDGVIYEIINIENGEKLNEFTFESIQETAETSQVSEVSQSEQKSDDKKNKIELSDDVLLKLDEISMEECVNEMSGKIDCAQCFCEALRVPEIKEKISQSDDKKSAIQTLIDEINLSQYFKLLFNKSSETHEQQSIHVQQSEQMKVELSNEIKNINLKMNDIFSIINKHDDALKELANVLANQIKIEQFAASKTKQKTRDDEIKEYKEKYFGISKK